MKKIVTTFALVAFLIGGFTITANAQEENDPNSKVKKVKVENADTKEVTTTNTNTVSIKDIKDTKDVKDAKDTKSEEGNKVINLTPNNKEVNYDQMLKDFETNVDQYIAAYEKALNAGNFEGSEYQTYLKKAQDLQAQLEKAMKDKKLSKSQTDLFIRIKAKLADALRRRG